MTRTGKTKPAPPKSAGSGRSQRQEPGRAPANTETFGRFLRHLARLESGSGRAGKGGERAR